jgi:hypothetical protein
MIGGGVMDELAAVCAPTAGVRAVTVSGTAFVLFVAVVELPDRGAS